MTIPSNYPQALQIHDMVENAYIEACEKHRATCGEERGPMGLTPDHVKATPEWKASRAEMDRAHRRLRDFNQAFLKQYKREWKETLYARRIAKSQTPANP